MTDPRAELDEAKLRRYEWVSGEPVPLANGQDWLVPSLPLEFRWPPRWRRLRRPQSEVEVGIFSPDARVCERILDKVLKTQDEPPLVEDQFKLCFHALRLNYRIEPEEASRLFDLKACFWRIAFTLLGMSGWEGMTGQAVSGPTDAGSGPAADRSASKSQA